MGTEDVCNGSYLDCMGCHDENCCCEKCLACQEIEEEDAMEEEDGEYDC